MNLSCHARNDILVVTITGHITDMQKLTKEFFDLIATQPYEKILVDVTKMTRRPSFAETYFAAQQSRAFMPGRITAVAQNKEHSDYAHFHELVFKNVGYRTLEYFYDYDEAMQWLEEYPMVPEKMGMRDMATRSDAIASSIHSCPEIPIPPKH